VFDLGRVVFDELPDPRVFGGQCGMLRADGRDAAVGKHHLEGNDVFGGCAVNRRPGARGIVGDHAAEGGPGACGNVRPEAVTRGLEKRVELIENHPGLHADRALLEVEVPDPAVVADEIHDEPIAHRAAGKPRARAARRDRHAGFGGRLDCGNGFLG